MWVSSTSALSIFFLFFRAAGRFPQPAVHRSGGRGPEEHGQQLPSPAAAPGPHCPLFIHTIPPGLTVGGRKGTQSLTLYPIINRPPHTQRPLLYTGIVLSHIHFRRVFLQLEIIGSH